MKNLLLGALILISTSAFASDVSIDLLNDARGVVRHEIRDIKSGNYSAYRAESLRSIILDIKNIIEDARHLTNSPITKDLIDLASININVELKDSYNFREYRLETVKAIMDQLERTLALAVKYDNK